METVLTISAQSNFPRIRQKRMRVSKKSWERDLPLSSIVEYILENIF
jgi:hypothetical protein